MNVERLKEYKSKLVVLPKRANKPKKGDATAEEAKAATQLKGKLFPIVVKAAEQEFGTVTETNAYESLRKVGPQCWSISPLPLSSNISSSFTL